MIAIDAYVRGHQNSTIKKDKNVIIVFQQIFGDSVVIQNSLQEYAKLFSASEGYTVKILVRSSVLSFMKNVLPLPRNIQFEVF